MKRIVILFLVFVPLLASSQQHIHKKKKLFHPYISLNYNILKISYPEYISSLEGYQISKFFGSEFGFSILPKTETGLYFNYNNKFFSELVINEIFKSSNSRYNAIENNLTSGYFGSIDIGKQIKIYNDNSQIIAGIRISDKYVSGVTPDILYHPEITEYDGFHIAPGIYGEYNRKLSKKYKMSVKLAITKSVLKHPFFSDLSFKLKHKSGLYLKAENNIMFSYIETKPVYRFSFGIGYRF